MPSKLTIDPVAGIYIPRLEEVEPGHLVSEFDAE
jgi:hypothetical protein